MVAPWLLLRRGTSWPAYRRSVDQAVLGRSTVRRTWSSSLAPLLFLHGTNGILLPYGITHELVEGPPLEGLVMDLGAQLLVEQGYLLHIRVDVVRTILCKVYEPLVVLVHHAGTLLKV
jgi:hypothetical protein